jgi:hypothetical protein
MCLRELQRALEVVTEKTSSADRDRAAELLKAQLQEAQANEQTWQELSPDDFDWGGAGESIEGRTAKGCEIVRAERRFKDMLRAVAWTDEYADARVCLRRGEWTNAAEFLVAAEAKAAELNVLGAGSIPPWFLWQLVWNDRIPDS